MISLGNPAGSYTSGTNGFLLHPNGSFVIQIATISPRVSVYSFDYKIGILGSPPLSYYVDPAGTPTFGRFTPNGSFLAISHATSPYVSVYQFFGDTGSIGSKISNPSTLPTSSGQDVCFSNNGSFMCLGILNSPWINVYHFNQVTGSIGTKVSNPSELPTGRTTRNVLRWTDNDRFIIYPNISSGGSNLVLYDFDSSGSFSRRIVNPLLSAETRTMYSAIPTKDYKYILTSTGLDPRFHVWDFTYSTGSINSEIPAKEDYFGTANNYNIILIDNNTFYIQESDSSTKRYNVYEYSFVNGSYVLYGKQTNNNNSLGLIFQTSISDDNRKYIMLGSSGGANRFILYQLSYNNQVGFATNA